jgi:hypothetical protein
MKRGILMSGQNPTKIIAGIKTETRRIIEPQPILERDKTYEGGHKLRFKGVDIAEVAARMGFIGVGGECLCPFGNRGDQLYIRESARLLWEADGMTSVQYMDGGDFRDVPDEICSDTHPTLQRWIDWQSQNKLRWRPSIHVPEWGCRTLVELLRVWVERIQDITQAGCEAEGYRGGCRVRQLFAAQWDNLHGAGAWKRNDWVFALRFKKLPGQYWSLDK